MFARIVLRIPTLTSTVSAPRSTSPCAEGTEKLTQMTAWPNVENSLCLVTGLARARMTARSTAPALKSISLYVEGTG
jgi:hypothetical protein